MADSIPLRLVELDEVADERIGVTAAKAAKVTGLSPHQIAAWEQSGLVVPRVHARLTSRHLRMYDMAALIELRVVAALQARRITIPRIKRIVDIYRRLSPTDRPLAQLRWGVDGTKVYVQTTDGGWWDGRRPGQGVIVETIDVEEIRAEVRRRVRQRELGIDGERTERRTRTMGGKELLAGTRTPVSAVAAYLRRGLPDSDILEAFPHLEPADINAVRKSLSA